MKALDLLKTNKTVSERAEQYATSMKRNIQKNVIDVLISKKERYEDDLFELTNFTLDTNINQGMNQMTKEDCEKRFTKIIEIGYNLELLTRELDIKQAIFDIYFSEKSKV